MYIYIYIYIYINQLDEPAGWGNNLWHKVPGRHPDFPSLSPLGHSKKSHWPAMCTKCAHNWPTRFEEWVRGSDVKNTRVFIFSFPKILVTLVGNLENFLTKFFLWNLFYSNQHYGYGRMLFNLLDTSGHTDLTLLGNRGRYTGQTLLSCFVPPAAQENGRSGIPAGHIPW